MGYFSDLDIDNQELEAQGLLPTQDEREPDLEEIMRFASAYTKTAQFKEEWAKFSKSLTGDKNA